MRKLTVNRVAMGNLRARSKQYALLIIGVILAMTFSSGSLFFFSSLNTTLDELHYSRYGRQCTIQMNCPDSFDPASLLSRGIISKYGYADTIAYGYTSQDDYLRGTAIAKLDDTAKYLSNQTLVEGTWPAAEGEIAIEKTALAALGFADAEVGSEINLTLETPDGNNGSLSATTPRTYKLTGILSDKRLWLLPVYGLNNMQLSPAYGDMPAAFVSSDESIISGGKAVRHCYIDMNSYSKSSRTALFNILDGLRTENGIDAAVTTQNVATFRSSVQSMGLIANYSVYTRVILAIMLTIFLLAASCFAIANAFNANLQQRRTQIGMLRALGATKKQIISIFGRETFIISLICTPVSMVLSYLAVFLVTKLMGSEFVFKPKLYVLLLCAAAGVVCVVLSSLLPLIKAAGIPPMQAIRNITLSRKMKQKKIVSQRSFDASKLLAKRNLIFYTGKRVGITAILIIGILLSSLGFMLVDYVSDGYKMSEDYAVDVCRFTIFSEQINYLGDNAGLTENDLQRIYDNEYTGTVYGRKSLRVNLYTDENSEYIQLLNKVGTGPISGIDPDEDEYYQQYLREIENIKQKYGIDEEILTVNLVALDSKAVEELSSKVTHGKIDIAAINSGKQVIMYAPDGLGLEVYRYDDGKIMSYGTRSITRDEAKEKPAKYEDCASNDFVSVGDTIGFTSLVTNDEYTDSSTPVNMQQRDCEVEVGAIITGERDNFGETRLTVATSLQGLRAMGIDVPYGSFKISLKSECTSEVNEEYMAFLKAITTGSADYNIASSFEIAERERETQLSYMIAITALVVLFFCVCTAMINNALSARIRESKREIGTLRAVGASQRELIHSYFRQLLSMFGMGCGIGFGLYLITYLGMIIYCRVYDSNLLSIQLWQPLAFTALMFAICYLNLRQKIHKEMKSSIVDNIREL